ncbi:hypothetical protein A1O1_07872 [Capronia coronata CBS 617.96]|uniref:RNase III domain-containing protein n=1 Tax=Capronia coronata CBS 617.96 TaxID=1182541 RepID=W9XMP1_9EURO|nr:uncharacterized protein A1O1_07872 [Capronia coronata CBS 617.96]EXJ81807.1 hypothetical protein A1O1_07872 [Capronia coronata CBS 617.96]
MASHEANVATCESIIQYVFIDKRLCLEAIQASGHVLQWQHNFTRVSKNDRLAVLGDVVTKAHLCEKWFATGRSKGQWTQAEQALLSNAKLSTVGYDHGLQDCVILNEGTPSVSPKTMATTVEAIFGAVFLDGGFRALGAVLVTLGLAHAFLELVMSNFTPCFFEGYDTSV